MKSYLIAYAWEPIPEGHRLHTALLSDSERFVASATSVSVTHEAGGDFERVTGLPADDDEVILAAAGPQVTRYREVVGDLHAPLPPRRRLSLQEFRRLVERIG